MKTRWTEFSGSGKPSEATKDQQSLCSQAGCVSAWCWPGAEGQSPLLGTRKPSKAVWSHGAKVNRTGVVRGPKHRAIIPIAHLTNLRTRGKAKEKC